MVASALAYLCECTWPLTGVILLSGCDHMDMGVWWVTARAAAEPGGNHGSLAMIHPTPTPTPNHLDHAVVRVEQAGGDRARAAAALGSRAKAITTHARAGLLVLVLGLGSGLKLVLGLRLGLWCPGWS